VGAVARAALASFLKTFQLDSRKILLDPRVAPAYIRRMKLQIHQWLSRVFRGKSPRNFPTRVIVACGGKGVSATARKGSGMSIEKQVKRLMADAKGAADWELFNDALERLARAWRDYADCYDPMDGPDWEDEEHPDNKRLLNAIDSQSNVNENATIILERSICGILGIEHRREDDNGARCLPYAPPAVTDDGAVERLRSAWNAFADVVNDVNDLGRRAYAHAYDATRVALEDGVRDLVGGQGPAYRHSNSR
jgi:hypothetical protein